MQEKFVSRTHDCQLTLESDLGHRNFSPFFSVSSRWLKKWELWCLISAKHPKTIEHFHSLAAVRREKQRQLRLSNWWIVHPFSSVRFIWEILMTFVYAVAFVTIPFMISFVVLDHEEVRFDTINPVIYGFFWLDIIFNCITGVAYKKELIALRHADIFKKYSKGFLVIDVLTSLPYDRITQKWRKSPGKDSSLLVAVINLIPLLKISRYCTFHYYVLQLFMRFRIKEMTQQMFSTLILSLYVCHWFACLCYVMPVLVMHVLNITASECHDCWVSNMASEGTAARYRQALFIVVQNFVASGFGAIEPKTHGHTIVCTILMILGPIFEAYIIIMFLEIRAISRATESKYQQIINQLMAYMRQKQLPPYMKRRLLAYYRYRFGKSYFREKTIISGLSDQLREEILLHSCGRLVENVAIFRNLPKDILLPIVRNLKYELYMPNDVIVKAGTQGDCMFFLTSGTVVVLTPTGREVCHLDDGAHFGEVALLVQDERRVASVFAIEICEVYRLDRADFRKCILAQSELYQKIERIATERMERTAMIEDQHKHSLMASATRAMSLKRARSRFGT